MSWGGTRTGAGRKPEGIRAIRQRRPKGTLTVMEHAPVDDEQVSAIPPEDLPADQRDFWHRNAARAIAQGTLTPRVVEGFRLLCELDAERRAVKKTLDRDGRTFLKVTVDGAGVEHQELKAHPLKADYKGLCKAVENLLARYKLASFGKAELPPKRKAAANPFAAFTEQVK